MDSYLRNLLPAFYKVNKMKDEDTATMNIMISAVMRDTETSDKEKVAMTQYLMELTSYSYFD